jgi:DNA polymerase III delta prime subunit
MSIEQTLQSILIEHQPAEWESLDWQSLLSVNPGISEILNATNHPDKLILNPSQGKYSVSDIDGLISWEQLRPVLTEYKIAIINQAEALTIEAQNKLLKTLEEPSPRTQLILVTSSQHALLTTILSRCLVYRQKLQLKNANHSDLAIKFAAKETSLADRMKLAEKIATEDDAAIITTEILDDLATNTLNSTTNIDPEVLLDIVSNYRKNKLSNRLTLETLAIMLK